jgi:hypothetical protein
VVDTCTGVPRGGNDNGDTRRILLILTGGPLPVVVATAVGVDVTLLVGLLLLFIDVNGIGIGVVPIDDCGCWKWCEWNGCGPRGDGVGPIGWAANEILFGGVTPSVRDGTDNGDNNVFPLWPTAARGGAGYVWDTLDGDGVVGLGANARGDGVAASVAPVGVVDVIIDGGRRPSDVDDNDCNDVDVVNVVETRLGDGTLLLLLLPLLPLIEGAITDGLIATRGPDVSITGAAVAAAPVVEAATVVGDGTTLVVVVGIWPWIAESVNWRVACLGVLASSDSTAPTDDIVGDTFVYGSDSWYNGVDDKAARDGGDGGDDADDEEAKKGHFGTDL